MYRFRRILMAVAVAGCVLSAGASVASGAPVPVKSGVADPTQFPQALQCVCHGMLVSEWQESMHSKALSDPIFTTKVAEADAASGGKLGPFCRRCHGPVANMTGQDGLADMTPAASQGVVCSFCHQVVDVKIPIVNVPHRLELTGVMRAQLKDAQSPHFTQFSALHQTSKICGGCHDVDHPGNGLHLETTYAEWKKSPQAAKGIQCQDCHMSEAPPQVGPSTGFAAEAAPERPNIYHMTFAGAQVALGNPTRATALLQSAAQVTVDTPEIVSAGDEVTVTVTNVGAGHYLPTGLTEVRQMWLTVTTVDASGKETEIGRRVFGTVFKDAKGKGPAEIQDSVSVGKDDRIPPTKSVTQAYKLALPAGVEATDVRARLLYQSVPDALAKKAGVDNPTTVMAEAVKRVFATEEAKAADAKKAQSGETSSTGTRTQNGTSPIIPQLICGGAFLLVAGIATALILRARKKA